MLPQTQKPQHPAEAIRIDPESLLIANSYLQLQSAEKVANELDVSFELVLDTLQRPEVKAYCNQVFFDTGYNNRFKLRRAMDAIISKKFEELDIADVGSNKDIIEILALSHKMTMEAMDKEIELEKIRHKPGPKTQTNIQINEGLSGGSNYGSLIERLIKTNTIDNDD